MQKAILKDYRTENIFKLGNTIEIEVNGTGKKLMDTDVIDSDIKEIISKKIKTVILDPCGWRDNQLPLNTIEYLRKQKNVGILEIEYSNGYRFMHNLNKLQVESLIKQLKKL